MIEYALYGIKEKKFGAKESKLNNFNFWFKMNNFSL